MWAALQTQVKKSLQYPGHETIVFSCLVQKASLDFDSCKISTKQGIVGVKSTAHKYMSYLYYLITAQLAVNSTL